MKGAEGKREQRGGEGKQAMLGLWNCVCFYLFVFIKGVRPRHVPGSREDLHTTRNVYGNVASVR